MLFIRLVGSVVSLQDKGRRATGTRGLPRIRSAFGAVDVEGEVFVVDFALYLPLVRIVLMASLNLLTRSVSAPPHAMPAPGPKISTGCGGGWPMILQQAPSAVFSHASEHADIVLHCINTTVGEARAGNCHARRSSP